MKEQLSNIQFIFLMIWGVIGNGIIFLPFLMAQFVTRDAWLSAVLFIASAAMSAGIAGFFAHAFPGQSLIQSFFLAFGPWLGRLASLWFLLWLYISTCMIFRNSVFLVDEAVLPLTPTYVVSVLAIVGISYAAYMGIEVMGRLAEIVTPLAVIMALVIGLLALKNLHFRQVMPILADGWTPVLKGTVLPWRFSTEALICLMFPNVLKQTRHIGRLLLIVGFILTAVGIVVEFYVVGILGEQAKNTAFPILEIVRTIEYGEFFTRFDAIYVMGVVFILILKLAVFQYAWSLGIKELFHLNDYRPVIWSGAMAIWAGSMFLWPNSEELKKFILFTSPAYFAATIVLLPIVVSVVQKLRMSFRVAG